MPQAYASGHERAPGAPAARDAGERSDVSADHDTLGNSFLAGQVGPEDPQYYGVVQNDALDASWVDRAVSIGARSLKVRLKDSDALVPGDPMFDFIAAAKARGMEVVVLFNHETVGTEYDQPDLEKTQQAARRVVNQIGHLVDAWEVWNEPQSIVAGSDMSAEMLMKTLVATYPTFSATGKAVLAAPEWTTGQGDDFRQQMADWWQSNRWAHPEIESAWPFDVMAVHAYFFPEWDKQALVDQSMDHISQTFGADMPVWVTEFGHPGDDAAQREQQSGFVDEVSGAFAKHDQVERMHYYSLKDYPGEESGSKMGLFDERGEAKPAADRWGKPRAPSGPFRLPRPELEGQFRAHLDAIGASGQVDRAHWDEWYAAYQANGGDAAHRPQERPAAGPFELPRPELGDMFFAHLDAIGASGQADRARWDEWYAAYQANGGDAAHGIEVPFEVPRDDLEDDFLDWLDATGAHAQITRPKWEEWFAHYRANGGR